MLRIYKCIRCGVTVDKTKAVRLTKKLYGVGRYQQFTPVDNFDFCPDCYKRIENTFKKWRKENELK